MHSTNNIRWGASLLALGSLLGPAQAADDQNCVMALVDCYGPLPFEGVGYQMYYESICLNPLAATSMYASTKKYCNEKQLDAGFKLLREYCVLYGGGPMLDEESLAENLTDSAVSSWPVLNGPDDYNATVNFTTPVMVSQDFFNRGFQTENDWMYEEHKHKDFGFAVYGFWGAVLVIGMVHRFITYLQERRMVPSAGDREGRGTTRSTKSSTLSVPYHWIRKHVINPSAIGAYKQEAWFGCTIPTRMESLVIYAFWVVSIILCAVDYRAFTGNLYWSAPKLQTWRYIADRTGIASYANLPLMWMFSGRNNVFLWLTGFQFSTFNLFHRHIARVATLEAIIHSIGYTAFYYLEANSWEDFNMAWKEPWFYMGQVATIVMSLIVVTSFRWFRHKIYETFLIIHILLSVVTIVGLFYHTDIFEGEYDPYLWPLVAIWSFDRLLRLVRQAYCNIHVFNKKGKTVHGSHSTVMYHAESNMLEIEVIPGTNKLAPGPGQHYYLYQPLRWAGWENHPFTLASWNTSALPELPVDERPASEKSPGGEVDSSPRMHSVSGNDGLALSFWVRPHKGWTGKLKDQVIKAGGGPMPAKLLIEGPYGKSEPLWTYDEVLLIAGGSGIAAVMPYLAEHIRRAAEGRTRTKQVHLVWANPKEGYARLLMEGPLAAALARSDVTATFHITGGSSSASSTDNLPPVAGANSSGEDISKELGLSPTSSKPTGATLMRGRRPNVHSLVEQAAATAHANGSRLAVFACGPAGLADDAREATCKAMKSNSGSVEYFEEAFGW